MALNCWAQRVSAGRIFLLWLYGRIIWPMLVFGSGEQVQLIDFAQIYLLKMNVFFFIWVSVYS